MNDTRMDLYLRNFETAVDEICTVILENTGEEPNREIVRQAVSDTISETVDDALSSPRDSFFSETQPSFYSRFQRIYREMERNQ